MKWRKIMMISIFFLRWASTWTTSRLTQSRWEKQAGWSSRWWWYQNVTQKYRFHIGFRFWTFLFSGAGNPQRPLGWWEARSERRRWRSCHPPTPLPPPAHLRLLLLNKQLLPPSILYHLFVSDCDNVGDHGDHDLRHCDDDQHALGKGDRPLRHRERSSSRAGQPGLISNFQTFKSIFYNFVCVWWFVIWIFQVKISNL